MITSDDLKNSEITFYGISKTIEVLTDILKEINLKEIETYKIKDVVDCIIKLDEQLEKEDIKTRCFIKCDKELPKYSMDDQVDY